MPSGQRQIVEVRFANDSPTREKRFYLCPKVWEVRVGYWVRRKNWGDWAQIVAVAQGVRMPFAQNSRGFYELDEIVYSQVNPNAKPQPPRGPDIILSVPEGVEVQIQRYDPSE